MVSWLYCGVVDVEKMRHLAGPPQPPCFSQHPPPHELNERCRQLTGFIIHILMATVDCVLSGYLYPDTMWVLLLSPGVCGKLFLV